MEPFCFLAENNSGVITESPKFCISIVSSFSRDFQLSQGKTKTMLMQNFGRQTKSIIVFSKVAYFGHFRKAVIFRILAIFITRRFVVWSCEGAEKLHD